ncbi:MAG TPA: 2-dehydropantoate 2-reductase [Xanthobacteraceae bacterium]|jgi:2-dehydropantoate 2-reductase|nr:2-dehydropantoate 2-reductase [Xanthobacteraceae bacterium]
MKVAVMGAGAVGCYFGAMLAQHGHDVVLIGRPQHVDAIHDNGGLKLESKAFTGIVPIEATTEPRGVEDADLVLFCVKSGDTESAGRSMAPFLKETATILSLQNGVDNPTRLQPLLRQAVVSAAVYVATEMGGPGHVIHHGRGDLVIGASAASDAIAAQLTAAAIPTKVSDRVVDQLWAKLVVNCAYNALSAVAQLPYGRLFDVEGVREVMRNVVEECTAVGQALGIAFPNDMYASTVALVSAMPNQYSSTAQDVARGRPSEIDYLNGYVARKGAELTIPTPVNLTLHSMVKLKELGYGKGKGRA